MKAFLILALLMSGVFAKSYKEFASKMNYETNYEVALKKAKEQKKDIMFFMIANFCPWCIKFEKRILTKNDIDTQIKKKYIPLIINREERDFPKVFDVPVVPAVHFVDYKTEEIKQTVVGYNNRYKFLGIIKGK
jgi:thioredoxin-related protein